MGGDDHRGSHYCQSGVWSNISLKARTQHLVGVVYQAVSDGFVAASAQCTAGWDSMFLRVGATNPPNDIWVRSALTGGGSTTAPFVTLAVRKGEFWQVSHSCGSAYLITFTPLN